MAFVKRNIVILILSIVAVACFTVSGTLWVKQANASPTALEIDPYTSVVSIDFGNGTRFVNQQVQSLVLVEYKTINATDASLEQTSELRTMQVSTFSMYDDENSSVPAQYTDVIDVNQYHNNTNEVGDVVQYELTSGGIRLGIATYQVDYVADLDVGVIINENFVSVRYNTQVSFEYAGRTFVFAEKHVEDIYSNFFRVQNFL